MVTAKVHIFKVSDVIATWFDTGAFGAKILFGVVIAAGPKMYRVRWESGSTNRIEQGRTICWLYSDWTDYTDKEIKRIEESLGVTITRPPPCRVCEGDGIIEADSSTPPQERVTRDSRRCPYCYGKGTASRATTALRAREKTAS